MKTGYFHDHDFSITGIKQVFQHWCTDITSHKYLFACRPQQVSDQACYRGLTVGAGNSYHRHPDTVCGQCKLAQDRDSTTAGSCQDRQIRRHTRTYKYQVGICKKILAVTTGLKFYLILLE